MKKSGFTLAEVLIAMAIVGIVSAIVLPTFTAKVNTSKIGPRLSKAVSVFESATRTILQDEDSTLSDIGYTGSGATQSEPILSRLGNHLKGTRINTAFNTEDGVTYTFAGQGVNNFSGLHGLPHQKTYWNQINIDINGSNAGPNRISRDIFYFQLMDDGSLRPWGGSWEAPANRWQTRCPKNQKPNGADADYCAGHVIENGLKVEYK